MTPVARPDHPLDGLLKIGKYRRLFTDAAFWTPFVREVCLRHGLMPCENVRVGIPGSMPAFIVEDRWLVKFFGKKKAAEPEAT